MEKVQVQVSEECAKEIERIREGKNYESEMEYLLEIISGLNDFLLFTREEPGAADFSKDIHHAIDKLMDYFKLLRSIKYV